MKLVISDLIFLLMGDTEGRLFKYEHFNSSFFGYDFSARIYPYRDAMIRFGIVWNFLSKNNLNQILINIYNYFGSYIVRKGFIFASFNNLLDLIFENI